MKQMYAVAFVMAAALAACGGGKKADTTPATTTEMKSDGTGGSTYGGATAPTDPGAGGSTADPCAGT
ncbi:MAG: hypothetical protein H0X17_18935 [Deltaproteobacteria bacterium]|nr:hypothetical protein [Deltaproteobacteria bacterium]